MSLGLNELRVVEYPTGIKSDTILLYNPKTINDDKRFVRPPTEGCEPFEIVQGDVTSGGPIIIYVGPCQSTLRISLVKHLKNTDVTLILFSVEAHLWQWFDANPSVIVASLVLQPAVNAQTLITRSRNYGSIHSVLIRCMNTEMLTLQRLCRSHARVDGIFDDDTRLLVKLFIDVALFCEEIGDQQRDDDNNEIEAQRNYDRALKLCALVRTICSVAQVE